MDRLSHRQAREVRTANVNRRGARVLIIGRKHPHHGETGTLVAEEIMEPIGGAPMAHVALDERHLGVEHCYATAEDLVPVTHSYSGGER